MNTNDLISTELETPRRVVLTFRTAAAAEQFLATPVDHETARGIPVSPTTVFDPEMAARDLEQFAVACERVLNETAKGYLKNLALGMREYHALRCKAAIYQVYDQLEGGWYDSKKEAYDRTDGAFRRVVYMSPPQQDAAIESKAAEQSVRDATLFDILMRRNIELTDEAYLSMRVVGVPPSEDEFVAALKKAIDAAIESKGGSDDID